MEYEIIDYAVPLGPDVKIRPCVVIDKRARLMMAISSEFYSKFRSECFKLESAHENFKATGLDHTSYVIGLRVIAYIEGKIVRRRGVLTGQLARQLEKWLE